MNMHMNLLYILYYSRLTIFWKQASVNFSPAAGLGQRRYASVPCTVTKYKRSGYNFKLTSSAMIGLNSPRDLHIGASFPDCICVVLWEHLGTFVAEFGVGGVHVDATKPSVRWFVAAGHATERSWRTSKSPFVIVSLRVVDYCTTRDRKRRKSQALSMGSNSTLRVCEREVMK